jgi:transcriptional regulator with XRE-family HTH domain
MISKMKIERIKRGLSQQKLYGVTGVPAGDISRIETCRMKPYPSQAARLARALGLSEQELQEPVGVMEAAAK